MNVLIGATAHGPELVPAPRSSGQRLHVDRGYLNAGAAEGIPVVFVRRGSLVEDFELVAVWIEEVDAVGNPVVHRAGDLDLAIAQMPVHCLERLEIPAEAKGEMMHLLLGDLGRLEQRDVVVGAAEGEEAGGEVLGLDDHLHAEHVLVPLLRGCDVGHVQHRMADSFDARH